MSRYNKPVDATWRNILVQCAGVIAVIFVIVWFLPRDGRSTYLVNVGKPWPFSQLIAPYEFIIYKSDKQIQREHDSIRSLYEPYFELQPEIENEELDRFREDYRSADAVELNSTYRIYIEEHLRAIYSRGILSTNDYRQLITDSCQSVRIYKNTESWVRSVSHVFSQKSAYEYLLGGADSSRISRRKLQSLNLNRYLRPNLIMDEMKSSEQWENLLSSLSPSSGVMMSGQSIIERGEVVTEEKYQIIKSYNREAEERYKESNKNNLLVLGQVFYVGIIIVCLLLYFNLFRHDYLLSTRSITLLVSLVLLYSLVTSFIIRHTMVSVYVIPYAMIPVFVRVFMDSRTAFITHAVTVFICAVSLTFPFEFITTQCVAGLTAIYTLRELSERSQLIRTSLLVTMVALVFYLGLDLLHGRVVIGGDSLTAIDWKNYQYIIVSGLLLLFAYPLMALLERVFGFTSNVTLVELSNINRDVLRRLSEEAPGTFQHSMQVSNLAAEVARKIGAKSQLVRTGALYHDIGKLMNPAFFTENQLRGMNPHEKLDYAESARIIINHVSDGEAMADKERLPRIIREFISTHHGHGLVKYFYISYKNQHPNKEVDPEPFTYPGHNPQTTEQAILMMADAVEASARSLKEYTEESIAQLVDRIIDAQMAEGLFVECPITFLDIKTAKDVFKEKLKSIYHTRISYPTLKKSEQA